MGRLVFYSSLSLLFSFLPPLSQKSPYPLLKYNYNVNISMHWQRIILEEKLVHMPCTEFHPIPNSYITLNIKKENYRL